MTMETRWWWIRHAPVVGHGGRLYGQDDHDCDCADEATFRGLSRALPAGALWVTSHLRRTHQTADSILAHLGNGAGEARLVEPDLAEQHFGAWQGLTWEELDAVRNGQWHRFWLAPAAHAPPGGESFVAVVDRVGAVVERLTREHAGRDIVAVSHGGTVRAALALALGLEPERALAFTIDNCSLTRLDRVHGPVGSHDDETDGVWRVHTINAAPGATPGREGRW